MRCNELFITLTYAEFQSAHPVWERTFLANLTLYSREISIHPSRVGWDFALEEQIFAERISIHPSRVGWDHLRSETKPTA